MLWGLHAVGGEGYGAGRDRQVWHTIPAEPARARGVPMTLHFIDTSHVQQVAARVLQHAQQ